MEQTERLPVRTQFLVFTLFGEYNQLRKGGIWTSSLLYILGLLGVSERAVRSTLSRMSRKKWLTTSKHGRRSQYSLTARGRMLLKQGEQRIFEPLFSDWDGQWQLVVYSLPEKKRRLRHYLRKRLTWFGFGRLAPGTWISPHDRKVEVEDLCHELGVQEHVELFSGTHLGLSLDQNLVKHCWDLQDLETQYHKFITRFQEEYKECQNQGNKKATMSPEDCFLRHFWLTYDFQFFPLKDPNLPTVLLPSDWIGYEARKIFDDYHRLLETHANQFVNSVLAREQVVGLAKTSERRTES
jgi:phenylacetic acid degradation operon negative regulatory protein